MKYELFEQLKAVLKKDERLVTEGELLRNRVTELARQNDPVLLKNLLADKAVKVAFFVDVEGVQVFDSARFVRFINNKEFLPDSYTSFKNKIGLAEGDEFVSEKKEIVLNWPYKDCVLEGGQTKEDAKRDEVFWNETLAPDHVHRLLDPKVFIDLKRIDAKGEHPLDGFKTDENGDIKDNLIIKGNNLLALHSLKSRFAGKVKLIYIDPPYNTGGDTFGYNDKFNHSAWLTFMRNRLEVAKELLASDGSIWINIDDNESHYLKVLCEDVLNLFDIVRLYETRQSGGKAISPATMAEAQLIGRGARYWPFALPGGEDDRYTRKFDEDLTNDLRILEELHYHTKDDSRYIAEIRNALVKTGALAAPENVREIDVRVKEGIKKTDFWKKGQVFVNERVQTGRRHITGLRDVPGLPTSFIFDLHRGGGSDVALFDRPNAPVVRELISRDLALDPTVWREAVYRTSFYHFDTLVKFFPHLTSIDEFITEKVYLGGVMISVRGEKANMQEVSRADELQAALKALQEIAELVENNTDEYAGTKTFVARPVHKLVKDKKLKITIPDGGDQEFGVAMREARDQNLRLDLASKDWYVYDENYGTREEKELVHFIHEAMEDLQKRYEDVRLLRNEKLFPLYRFSDGRRVEPDFVLFLGEAGKKHAIVHQLFIEPKGPHLFALDAWKEEFLKEIAAQGKIENLFENDEYRVIGLPFYKHGDNGEFEGVFEQYT